MRPSGPLFLHVTDAHLAPGNGADQGFREADIKTDLPGISKRTRKDVFAETLRDLARRLAHDGRKLHGVIVSGDASHQGAPNGASLLRDVLTNELGIQRDKIVVVPGNHDVARGTTPGSADRYKEFVAAWRAAPTPCVTPLLDGIEHEISNALTPSDPSHLLLDQDERWAVIPINSANWCQITKNISDPLRAHLNDLKDVPKTEPLARELERLLHVDAARVSHQQLDGLAHLLEGLPSHTLKIAVLHHHLLPVSTEEELKEFADIVNLGLLRQFLRQHNVRVVIHGHKHRSQMYYDHVYDEQGCDSNAHRVLVVSGGTLMQHTSKDNDPFRLIEFCDLPHAPVCKVTSIPLKIAGISVAPASPIVKRVWEPDEAHKGPFTVYGTNVSDVYARACQLASSEGKRRPLICTLDLPPNVVAPKDLIPEGYPLQYMGSEPANRLEQIVTWWQLPHSKIEKRIPFIHGTRLKNYGGTFDQLNNVVKVLRLNPYSSKAIAILIDPIRDLAMAPKRGFASFCLVQFRGRGEGQKTLDCIGYYRAQEFIQWWPVNIAELRQMQQYVADELSMALGHITTVTGDARVTADNRTPTQVAVPLIDQWLDTHAERIPMMSRAISGCQADTGCRASGMKYLEQCLNDIYASTETFQEDGNPVAIEGIEFLIKCLEQECGILPKVTEVVRNLKSLLKANATFERIGEQKAFEEWKADARTCIQAIAASLDVHVSGPYTVACEA